MRHDHRHCESSDGRRRAHPAECNGSTVQNLIGKNRHQCRCAPEQNRKQIQCDRCQNHLSTEHESDASDETFPRACLGSISYLRGAADRKNEKKKRKRAERVQQIHKRKPDIRDKQSADGGADN